MEMEKLLIDRLVSYIIFRILVFLFLTIFYIYVYNRGLDIDDMFYCLLTFGFLIRAIQDIKTLREYREKKLAGIK